MKKRISANQERADPLLDQRSQRQHRSHVRCWRVRIRTCSPSARAAALHVLDWASASGWLGLIKYPDLTQLGKQLKQQFQPLRVQLGCEQHVVPVTLPPGRLRLATSPSLTGSRRP